MSQPMSMPKPATSSPLEPPTHRCGDSRLTLATIILVGERADWAGMSRTLAALDGLCGETLVACRRDSTWLQLRGERSGIRTHLLDAAASARQAMVTLAGATNTPWRFWLWAGESVSADSRRMLEELVQLQPPDVPPVFFCGVREIGRGRHLQVDLRQRDEPRLLHRDAGDDFQGDLWPRLPPDRFHRGTHCATAALVIDRPGDESASCAWTTTASGDSMTSPATLPSWERLALAQELLERGQSQTAAEHLQAALRDGQLDQSERATALANLIRAQREAGNTADTQAALDLARAKFPAHAAVLYQTGIAWHLQGRLAKAIGCYQAAVEAKPLRGQAWWDEGLVAYKAHHQAALAHLQLGQLRCAEELWREVLRRAPMCRQAQAGLCELLLRDHRPEEAQAWSLLLQANRQTFAQGVILRAACARAAGDVAEARRQLERGIRQQPDHVALLQAMCEHFQRHGPAEEAGPVVDELARLRPDSTAAALNTRSSEQLPSLGQPSAGVVGAKQPAEQQPAAAAPRSASLALEPPLLSLFIMS
jgi:tetratricopeptide (TPR) repeat protein